jgi:hypothetical protein
MTIEKLPKNDGWADVDYDLGSSPDDNARVSKILNEACHVFRHHASGVWTSDDKDAYAGLLVAEIDRRSSLVGRLLKTDDRVVKMITHRALELIDARKKPAP